MSSGDCTLEISEPTVVIAQTSCVNRLRQQVVYVVSHVAKTLMVVEETPVNEW